MVQMFRRPESAASSITVKARGLDPDARYDITDLDVAITKNVTGRSLMDAGLTITIGERPGSAILTYKRIPVKQESRKGG